MTAILALDTASEFCSVSLVVEQNGKQDFFSSTELAPRSHVQNILPMIKDVLQQAGQALETVDAIAFGRGPGSFTGLRIASGVTQGLAFGQDIPVVAVSNLRAAALHVFKQQADTKRCLVMFDARMNEVYWALADRDKAGYPQIVDKERVDKPAFLVDTLSTLTPVGVFGSGLEYKDDLGPLANWPILETPPEHPAELIAELALLDYHEGKTLAADQAGPVYIRDEVTWKKLPGRE